MSVIWALLHTYPRRSIIMLAALLVAGLAEGFSLTALLPLLEIASGEAPIRSADNPVLVFLGEIGVEPGLGTILVVIVVGVLVKSLLLLVGTMFFFYQIGNKKNKKTHQTQKHINNCF